LFADALGSVGAIVAGLLIWRFGWNWADAMASMLIAGLIVWSSWSLVRQSVNVLMEGAPAGIDVDEVRNAMVEVAGVREVHDLHVWSISSGMESLSAHVIVSSEPGRTILLGSLQGILSQRFGIEHVTIQVEEQHCGAPAHDA
jgi:cobalt-zinc-cadmium efflux system protein